LATILNTITNAVAQATQVSSIIKGAQADGRTALTDGEWQIIQSANASSREALVEAIQKALSGA
jgi:vacuolar-type H+-ATPase subunit E/Vma4